MLFIYEILSIPFAYVLYIACVAHNVYTLK